MKQEISFKLIQSSYARNDAREVLISLLNDKIRFLSRRIFSLQERFGCDTRHEEARLSALKASRENLLEILNSMKMEDRMIIDCDVRLKFRDQQPLEDNTAYSTLITDTAYGES